MSELIPPPTDWNLLVSLTAASMSPQLGNHRLLSIKTFLDGSSRLYSGVSVPNIGLGGSWAGRILPDTLRSNLGKTMRLTALDCFEERRKTFCAAAWVNNLDSIEGDWDYDLTPKALNARLAREDGKLISLRAYRTTMGGKLSSPAIRYCAIWVKDDGLEWDWIPDAVEDSISDTLDAKAARLISIDNLDNTTWLGDQERFCAVWYANVPGTWFWNIGLDKSAVQKEPPKFCSWPLDVSHCTKTRFVSLLDQYPKPADPSLASLMAFGGSGDAFFRDDLWIDFYWYPSEQNLTSETVTVESAFMFSAAEGGWSWWSADFTADPGQGILGVPLSLPPAQTQSATWGLGHLSNNPKIGVFALKATTPDGKHQDLLPQVVLIQPGFAPSSPLPIQWPVFLGVQAPVEVVKLTNGKYWVTVASQIVNGTGQKLDITHASVKLKDQANVTVHKAYFTDDLLIDQDVHGTFLAPTLTGPVLNSDAPLPKFYDAFEVPHSFKNGTVKVQANVRFVPSELDCYGDKRILPVKFAPMNVMTRLPYDVPVIDGQPNPSYRWRWGSGIGGTTFPTHTPPEERYAYDVAVVDPNGQTFKDPTKMLENDNYYCWGQPVLAMSAGKVLFVYHDYQDNLGNSGKPPDPNLQGTNIVVVYNESSGIYQLYAHVQQGSIIVNAGDPVSPGGQLASVGNAGATSEPHLHVGISRRDSNGSNRSLPMTFQKIIDSANQTVTGAPVTGETYRHP